MFKPPNPEGCNTLHPVEWIETHMVFDCENCTENSCSGKTGDEGGRHLCEETLIALEKLYDGEKFYLEEKIIQLQAQVNWLAGVADISAVQDRLADAGNDFWRTMKNTRPDIIKAAREATSHDR